MKCYAKSSENLIVQLANLPPKPPFLSKSFHLFSCTGKTHYLCISSAKNKEQNKTFLPFNFQNIGRQLVQYAASEFLSKEDLEILHENIECFAYGQSDLYKPIRSKVDNSLRSIDLMHFVWNIGERLDISLIDRATFIHTIFPHELKDASIKYLAKNLRTCGVCKIALDIPKTGDYHFKITKFCTV